MPFEHERLQPRSPESGAVHTYAHMSTVLRLRGVGALLEGRIVAAAQQKGNAQVEGAVDEGTVNRVVRACTELLWSCTVPYGALVHRALHC